MKINMDNLYSILDSLLSEYGGSLEYWIKVPHPIIIKLNKAIINRKREDLKLKAKVYAVSVSAGFNGKMELIDKLFSSEEDREEINKEQFKAETKAFWIRLGKDPEEFEKKWSSGEQIIM